jgi:hypothetical protein
MYDGANGGMAPGPNNSATPGGNGGSVPPTPPPAPLPPQPSYNVELPPVMNATPPPDGTEINALTVNYWIKTHWKLVLLILFAVFLLGETIFQIVYPGSRLIPGTKVDGVDLGGLKYADAAKKLDGEYGNLKLDIFFGKNGAAFQSPKMSDVGIGVDNNARLSTISYPFYLRIIPGSILWAPGTQKTGDISYTYDKNKINDYTLSKVGSDCSIPSQNASLKLDTNANKLQLVPSVTGGNCDINDFQQKLAEVKPDPDKQNTVRIDINETPAPITDNMARELAGKLNDRMAAPMPISVDAATDTVPGRIVLSWLDFKADVPQQTIDNSANQQASLKFSVNQKRMQDYLDQGIAAKLIKEPGVSKISTHDFTETSRVNGANGRALDVTTIAKSVEDYINNKIQKAIGATVVVGPKLVYTRSYSPTSVGFSALLSGFAQDNPGNYSLAFQELSGVDHPRSAQYHGDVAMPAAGIHSLYLALTDVYQEYNGAARPVDIISGDTNALDCFKLMLQRDDDGCRKGFYNYLGYATLTSRASTLGLSHTTFAGEDTTTSANDLQKTIVGIYKGQIARVEGGQKILSSLRAIRENDGLPAGSGSTEVSHIIGEGENIYNDSAVIYNTNYGAYAVTVMSNGEGTSWDLVSKLAQKILSLKSVKIPKDAR